MESVMTEPSRPVEPNRAADSARAAEPATRRGLPSRRWKLAGIAVAVAGVLALGACSHGPGRGWDDRHAAGQMDPERAARFTEKMADRVVSAVDGTPEQRQKIAAIARDAMKDLVPMRERVRAARRQSIELLGAATIDRPAIERLRAEQVGLADTASKRLAQALADTAEVLTPEQRVKLAERMSKRMGRWS
jgi:protein CpxP